MSSVWDIIETLFTIYHWIRNICLIIGLIIFIYFILVRMTAEPCLETQSIEPESEDAWEQERLMKAQLADARERKRLMKAQLADAR